MKKIILIISLLASITSLYSQDTTKQVQEEYFIVLYTVGENWDTTKQYHEQLYFSEHSELLNNLRETRKAPIGARYSDTGMIILKANNMSKAQKIITDDPAVKNEIFKVEIFEFYPFYGGCIE